MLKSLKFIHLILERKKIYNIIKLKFNKILEKMDYYTIFADYLEQLRRVDIDGKLALQIASAGTIGLVALYIG